jgi:hypothetical protein
MGTAVDQHLASPIRVISFRKDINEHGPIRVIANLSLWGFSRPAPARE